jgi:hypothetical protein
MGTIGWGDIPVDFYVPEKEIINILPVYYIDKQTRKLSQINCDGDYGHTVCIETVKMALKDEKITPNGAVVALYQGGKQ